MTYPDLLVGILTYKRPWYGTVALMSLLDNLRYDGNVTYLISDGGSPDWQLEMYRTLFKERNQAYLIQVSDNVADMMNAVADHAQDLWLTVLDDYSLEVVMNITPDVRFLMQSEDVGHIRMGRMAYWTESVGKVYAELRQVDAFEHYWVLDKARCEEPYMWTMGFGLTHRRMWDAYGTLPKVAPHQVGDVEKFMNHRFHANKDGVTIAIPLRIPQNNNMYLPYREPIRHWGYVRTDEYSGLWGGEKARWGAV